MTRRILLTLVLALSLTGAAFADPVADAEKTLAVKTFQLKHKEADKVAAMIKPLMSADASVTIQPGTKSISVTDTAENLKAIAAAIGKYDAPAQMVQFSVRLIGATRGEPRMPDELKDVSGQLALLPYKSFDAIGSANVEGREGENGFVDIGNGYRAEFRFGEYDPATDTIRISDFKLGRLQNDQLTPLLKTTLHLKAGQVTIVSAAREPQSARAVMIVFKAKR